MSSEETVKLGYASSQNISFRGEWDTMIPRSEWKEMSAKEREEVENEVVWELVELWVIDGAEFDEDYQ